MSTAQNQFLKKSAVTAIMFVSAIAVGAFSQSLDTAKVPVKVNVSATVSIQPPDGSGGVGGARTLTTKLTDTLIIRLPKTSSISYWTHGQAGVPAMIKSSAGKVSLNLPAASYKSAEVSLYTVNGKRVMSEKVTASSAVNNISHPNIAAGAYVLSVKGIDGGSFTARHAHGGGSLNVSVTFGGENAASADRLKKEVNSLDAASWTIKATATGYDTVSYEFTPVKGMNQLQNITLTPKSTASGGIGCSRDGLTAAVDAYLAALQAGNHNLMPLAPNAKYIENDNSAKQTYSGGKTTYDKAVPFGEGLWKTPLKPDFHRNLIDVQECATFTEIIIADTARGKNPKQYVLGARLKVTGDKISEVSLVVTQSGDWGFNAKTYLNASSSRKEDSVWAKPGYIEREELRAAAYAYFAYFGDKTVDVPWGIPCTRVEGGMSTGDTPTSTCNVGVPDVQISPSGITYLADVDYGMAVLFLYFGGADTHMFKMLPSPTRYRYIHTLTAMKQSDYQPPR
ncbi:MAG: hypothetical protein LBC59_04150 [Chitinispirillales bacterium]|jgi:hypothetical protein|nr:hypothetical protein [Chitinispirillales bacterium]